MMSSACPPGWQRVLLCSVLWSGLPWPNRCLHRLGRSWQPGSCSATLLVRQPRLTPRGNDMMTSTASSTSCRVPQAQQGGSVSRQRCRQGGASGFVHSSSVRSARTKDLRAELNRRRAGEDARIAIGRAHDRRLNIEGRDLMPNLLRQRPRRKDLSRHRWSRWVAQRSQTTSGSGLAVQVSATSAGEVRRDFQPVRIRAGLHNCHHGG
jgi:hypothetical protein